MLAKFRQEIYARLLNTMLAKIRDSYKPFIFAYSQQLSILQLLYLFLYQYFPPPPLPSSRLDIRASLNLLNCPKGGAFDINYSPLKTLYFLQSSHKWKVKDPYSGRCSKEI